jgi:hypothetical protein
MYLSPVGESHLLAAGADKRLDNRDRLLDRVGSSERALRQFS